MDQFPMFRLLTLLMRQASAPIATRIKTYASTHPWFSKHVCMATGRLFHVMDLRLRIWSLALAQPRTISPLSDAKALEDGGNLLGEGVLFLLGSIIILLEVNRQAGKQEEKEMRIKSEWMALLEQLEELRRELELQQQDIDRLFAVLRQLSPKSQVWPVEEAHPAPPSRSEPQ